MRSAVPKSNNHIGVFYYLQVVLSGRYFPKSFTAKSIEPITATFVFVPPRYFSILNLSILLTSYYKLIV